MTLAAPTITDWISASASVIAALGAIGTLIVALILIVKQYKALSSTVNLAGKQEAALIATTKALNDEMEWRRHEKERQRAEQAARVRLEPFQLFPNKRDPQLLMDNLQSSGVNAREVKDRFEVTNASDARITNVQVGVEHENGPRCYITDFEEYAGANPVAVLPPGQSARFYWVGHVSALNVYVDFTDEAGVKWRLHHRDGLSEVTGPA